MKAEENAWIWKTWTIWFGRGVAVLPVAVIACCSMMMAGCKKASEPARPVVKSEAAASVAKVEDPATRELRAIGDRVMIAVGARDINTLLEYDHDPDDAASLKNKSGDLYCYLFDSSCIQGGKTRAVYDILSTSRQLAIDASTAKVQDTRYGLLMFYDKSQISDTELYSPDFLCSDRARKGTASWHFVLANGKWSTSTLFDYKIERSCKQ
ncbi:MAG TPA: hypothetical protein VI488_11745 [Candidatus Angelobacter sp.]